MILFHRFITTLIILILIGYTIYISRTFWSPPQIVLYSPAENVVHIQSPLIVSGMVTDTQTLFLNERRIYTDPTGYFEEVLTPPEGYAVVTITAIDSRENKSEKTRNIIILPKKEKEIPLSEDNEKENSEN